MTPDMVTATRIIGPMVSGFAPQILKGIKSKLNPTELEKALKAGIEAALGQEAKLPPPQQLFSRVSPDFVGEFLKKVFRRGEEELQRPLKGEGMPQVNFLVEIFKQVAAENPHIQPREDRIEPWMRTFVSSYFEKTQTYIRFQLAKQDYCQQLVKWFADVKFAGISVAGEEIEKSGRLAQIFVMPDVESEVQSRPRSWLTEESLTESGQQNILENSSGRKFSAAQLLTQSQSRKNVLLGAPGAGKTTLMSYFAVMLAQNQPEILGLDPETDWLPILMRMRDLGRYPDIGILDYGRQFAEKTMAVQQLPGGFFEYWLSDGRALILLDGLDEVAQEAKRYDVVKRIESFLGQFEGNRAIITSRPAGYKRDFFRTEEFPHYQLQSFDDAKIEKFINYWYDSRVPEKEEAQRRKDSLIKALDDNDRIKLLARNPLLLTIIALIHRYQAQLPKERYKLYDKAVETLLTSWDANKALSNHQKLEYLGLDDLRRLMESLAYWIHTQGSTGDKEGGTLIDRDELIGQLSQYIKRQKQLELHQAREEAKRFVKFIQERTGLLNEQGTDYYALVHKTFQEYLCAQEIDYQRDNEDDFNIVLNCIKEHLHEPHWREVLLLLIAQQKPKNAAKAIRAILNRGSEYEQWLHRDLLFAGSCLAEDPKNLKVEDNGLSQKILEKLVALEVSDEGKVGTKVRARVFETICSLGETNFEKQALQLLQERAEHLHEWRYHRYQAALGKNKAVIANLLEQLHNKEHLVRRLAAIELGKLGNVSETVVTALLAQLKDENYRVRYWATDALSNLGSASETVVSTLQVQLEDDDSSVRYLAADALGNLGYGSETVVNTLLAGLEDDNFILRAEAAYALGKLSNASERVVAALLARLQDNSSRVRYIAAYALSRLCNVSQTVVTALLARFQDNSSPVRTEAAYALCNSGNASEMVVNTLLAELNNEDATVRFWTTAALGNLSNASETVVTAVLARLKDEDSSVRDHAAIALSKLSNNSQTVVSALLGMLQDRNLEVLSGVAYALGRLGHYQRDVLPAVVQWIEQHQDSEYLGYGIDVLWNLLAGRE